jgi:hypothetical protein
VDQNSERWRRERAVTAGDGEVDDDADDAS